MSRKKKAKHSIVWRYKATILSVVMSLIIMLVPAFLVYQVHLTRGVNTVLLWIGISEVIIFISVGLTERYINKKKHISTK